MQLSNFDAFVGPSYSYQSLPIDCQECINFECLKVGSTASPFKNMLVSTAGMKHVRFRIEGRGEPVDELPTNKANVSRIRGMHKCSYSFYGESIDGFIVVGSDIVWRMGKPDDDLVCDIYKLGVISDGRSRVSIVDIGYIGEGTSQKIVIADGVTLYYIDMSTLSFGSNGNIMPQRPTSLTTMDGRVFMAGTLLNDGSRSQYVYFSELFDPVKWAYTDCVQAYTNSDPVLAVKNVGNYIWMIGTDTYEVWQTSSSDNAPIRRVSGIETGVGTCSADSVASIAASVFFVGGGKTGYSRIYEGDSNGTINVISTDAMAEEFSRYVTIEDAVGFTWADGGNVYYGVTFPTQDVTWVYNVRSGNWHKRMSQKNSTFQKWRVDTMENAFGTVFGASVNSGRVYEVSDKYYDEDGETIIRKRVAPHLRSNGRQLNHSSFELDLECGNANASGYGSDPQVMLRPLDDGGRTPRQSRWKSSGTMGMYRRRVKWYRLGTAVDRCYEVTVSDPIRWVIYGAVIGTEEGIGGR